MGIGASIFLVAVGAILTFAVDVTVSGLDIAVVGIVLMIAGVVGTIINLAVLRPRRRRVSDRQEQRPYVEETYDDGTTHGSTPLGRTAVDHRPRR